MIALAIARGMAYTETKMERYGHTPLCKDYYEKEKTK
jgi:hypothetical protein